jgi:predicted phosphodiesterase
MAKITSTSLARELCEKFPNVATRTLAHKLYNANKERFASLESARGTIRTVRGTCGKRNRWPGSVTHPKAKGKAGWKPSCPPSAAEPWLPVQIDGPCRVLSLSDIHIPYHDEGALNAAVKYGKKLKPDVLLLNGDFADFYRISRWQQDPKKRSFKDEISDCCDCLSWLRGQFRDARIIYKMGNHDERWDHYVWQKCVELFDLDSLQLHNVLKFEDFGIERVNDNPVMCGKLPVLHGHEIGKGIFSPVNPARGAFLRTNHTVLIGHLHQPSSHPAPDMFHSETMTWSQGCLCNRQPEYARINKWAWGFAHIDIAADNQFNVRNYRISNDYQVRSA